MFEHSVKVPRLYKISAKILQEVKEKGISIKQLVYKCSHRNIKGIYALVAETLKHFSEITTLIEKTQLLTTENRFDPWLARILITELLWSGKSLPSNNNSKPITTILSYRDALEKYKLELDSKPESKTIKKVRKPRFVRINTLAVTLEEATNGFREEGWTLTPFTNRSYEEFVSRSAALEPYDFMIDVHIKELFLFPFHTPFYKHEAYRSGSIILQDKASCLPSHLLNPTPGSSVLDMCAAPGLKTTHLAALLNNEGTVYAVERDENRFKTLNDMVENAGATCVKTINRDVLTVTAEDCPNVEYILVDPSCSGSGMTDRVAVDDEDNADLERLGRLSRFQIIILKHALTHFPQAKRVVYSTCSIYREENEFVIEEVLKNNPKYKLISAKSLLNGPWKTSLGEQSDPITDKCLFTDPEQDLTNGFFIAVFERDDSIEQAGTSSHKKKCKKSKRNSADIEINQEVTDSEKKRETTENLEDDDQNNSISDIHIEKSNKKERKKSGSDTQLEDDERFSEEPKKKNIEETPKESDAEDNSTDIQKRKSKKKKRKESSSDTQPEENETVLEEPKKKKKKKNVDADVSVDMDAPEKETVNDATSKSEKRKKKKSL